MRFIAWIFNLALAGIVAAFAFANREMVEVGIWPLPAKIGLPVYVLALVVCLFGFFLGLLSGWWGRFKK